jgi:hypothetical protein
MRSPSAYRLCARKRALKNAFLNIALYHGEESMPRSLEQKATEKKEREDVRDQTVAAAGVGMRVSVRAMPGEHGSQRAFARLRTIGV